MKQVFPQFVLDFRCKYDGWPVAFMRQIHKVLRQINASFVCMNFRNVGTPSILKSLLIALHRDLGFTMLHGLVKMIPWWALGFISPCVCTLLDECAMFLFKPVRCMEPGRGLGSYWAALSAVGMDMKCLELRSSYLPVDLVSGWDACTPAKA